MNSKLNNVTSIPNQLIKKVGIDGYTTSNIIDNVTGTVTISGSVTVTLGLPSSSGVLALSSSIPTSASFLTDYDSRYVNVTGDTMTGTLNISKTFTSVPAEDFIALNSDITVSAPDIGSALNNFKNYQPSIIIDNSGTGNQFYGTVNNFRGSINVSCSNGGTINVTNVAGIRSSGISIGEGVHAEYVSGLGLEWMSVMGVGASADNLYGINIDGYQIDAGATVNNWYGIYIGGSGVVDGPTATNHYGIYQEETSANNYFGGSVTVADIAGVNGNIVVHDAVGKLVDSGVNILNISGGSSWTPIAGSGVVITPVGNNYQFDVDTSVISLASITGNSFTPNGSYTAYSYTLNDHATIYCPTDMANGESKTIRVIQPETVYSLSFVNDLPFVWKFSNGNAPVITSQSNAIDILTILRMDTDIYVTIIKNFLESA